MPNACHIYRTMYQPDHLTKADLAHLGPVAVAVVKQWLGCAPKWWISGESTSHAYYTGRVADQVVLPARCLTLTLYVSRRGRWVVGTQDHGAAVPADSWAIAAL